MIETERLILRPWRDSDRVPFATMSADPEVMATLGPLMSREESDKAVDRCIAVEAEHGHTFWALERKDDGTFLGWCGLIRGPVEPILGQAEIGWRLARDYWGQGYATEAARAALEWAWRKLPDDEVVAITAQINHRSQAVMRRLGMIEHGELAFEHPKVPEGDPLRPHVVFTIVRP